MKRLSAKMEEKAFERAKKYDNYTVVGLIGAFGSTQDTKMAPSIYAGPGAGLRHEMLRMASKNMVWSKAEGIASTMGRTFMEGDYMDVTIRYQMAYLFKTPWLKNQLFLGAGLDALNQYRDFGALGNSGIYNDLAIALTPTAMYLRKTNFKERDTWLFVRTHFNLFSYVNKLPVYGLSSDGSSNYYAPVGQFNRFGMEIGYSRLRKWSSENRFGVSYSWDFYGMNEYDGLFATRSGQHLLTFSWWTKTR